MKIEFTKKQLTVAAIALGVIALSFVGGWFFGVNSTKNPKGDGDNFFVESQPIECDGASTTIIYHSTIDCPNIKYGVRMNRFGIAYEYNNKKPYPFYYCPKCMDSELIHECGSRISAAFED